MPTTDERFEMLKRMESQGYDPEGVAEEAGCTLSESLDVLLKVRAIVAKAFHAEDVKYTGKTRTYSNGAVAQEIRCRKCGLCWWNTGVPCAYCPDCEPGNSPIGIQ